MKFKTDCRYFRGYKPCKFHKEDYRECDKCKDYSPWDKKILIIKQGEIGDVLRTTPILKGLKNKYLKSYIVWLVEGTSEQFIISNDLIDEVLVYNPAVLNRLMIERYDLVINLDKDIASTAIASMVQAYLKKGFGFNKKGYPLPFNTEAQYKWDIGISDNLNRKNKLNYVEQVLDIAGLPRKYKEYQFKLPKSAKKFARDFRDKHYLKGKTIIGFNTGCGSKFQPRKWPIKHWVELSRLIGAKYPDIKILLFGGPYEKKRNQKIMEIIGGNVIDTGTDNSIMEFCGLIGLCDLLITSVTMALHVAIALNKRLIVMMGPLVPAEIDTYGLGPIITSKEHDCLGCFKDSCDKQYQCMEAITPKKIFKETEKFIKQIGGAKK